MYNLMRLFIRLVQPPNLVQEESSSVSCLASHVTPFLIPRDFFIRQLCLQNVVFYLLNNFKYGSDMIIEVEIYLILVNKLNIPQLYSNEPFPIIYVTLISPI